MNEIAIDFNRRACAFSHINRFSANQALSHTWITGHGKITDPL